ncbi:LPS export ABC transporter periplasmic protein LptC [Synechococcus sp. A15-60]|uniref:LPS export ABC transporter periplasmic protein LptC n=1 Tax=Synechococcus sp. A15-60 TaxID=1050655 RepID=UPI001862D089|nr:LPS export ABC transporter periplasmic protein LptC [Synechococcus sp. A15-60]QNI48438.1 LptC-related/ lipopolysaccharide assembly protein [Synechococcus sp. A15-60]
MRARAALRVAMLAVITGLIGCADEGSGSTSEAPPFVFRSLKLNQKKPDGLMDWSLNSPEARYELSRQLVRARDPIALLYKDGKPSFRVQSDLALVVNDGEQILLEGDVRLQQLNGAKLLIQGDRLRWQPEQGLLLIEQRPRATDGASRIGASEAQLQQRTNDLTLNGVVELERWNEDADASNPDTTLRTGPAQWNLDTGLLNAQGPVLGQRRDEEGTVLEQLQGQNLRGNTIQGDITVQAPVNVQIPREKGVLRAQDTTWNFREQTIRSEQPFEADLDEAQIAGGRFRADLNDTTIDVISDCRIEQPGEKLTADRCLWNWQSEEVLAEGNVQLLREANDQITRASRLEGRVGEEGLITFTAPGGKVESQVRFRSDEQDPSSGRRNQSAPVEF